MTSRVRLLLGSVVVAVLLAGTAPAYAGDVPGPNASARAVSAEDVIGDWQGPRVAIEQTVTFHDDGTVSGDAGCNSFSGTYSVASGKIKVGPLAATLKLCDDATMYAEQMFLAKLQTAKRVTKDCANLELTGPQGTLSLSPVRPKGQPVPVCAGVNNRP